MRNQTIYPKVYATILEYVILGQRVGIGQVVKRFTPAEWETASSRPGKRRYYYKGDITRVKLDTGEELSLTDKQLTYNGGRIKYQWQVTKKLQPGCKIKMYHHPKDRREWRFKLLGE
jgi:hypothetical protein